MTHEMQKRWFLVAAIVIAGGAPMLMLAGSSYSWITHWTLDLLSWPLDGDMIVDGGAERLLSPILGGILIGWGVTMWLMGRLIYDVAPEPTRKAALVGLSCWFVADSLGSIAAGIPANAVWNILFYAIASYGFWRPVAR